MSKSSRIRGLKLGAFGALFPGIFGRVQGFEKWQDATPLLLWPTYLQPNTSWRFLPKLNLRLCGKVD